jgi:hypothetical protein
MGLPASNIQIPLRQVGLNDGFALPAGSLCADGVDLRDGKPLNRKNGRGLVPQGRPNGVG